MAKNTLPINNDALDLTNLGGIKSFPPGTDGMNRFERALKRTLDCITAGGAMIIFSPLFLICYIVIRREDRGPAIFRQERIGLHGKPFYIYKFRSMRTDAEDKGPELYHGSDDDRVTRIGRFLRNYHLDELPQLYNVFIGDMALVGHRPERKVYIDKIMQIDPRYEYLYLCRPGVTSIATLRNGYTDTMEKMLRRLRYDLFYLHHRSWGLDMRILATTFFRVIGLRRF